MMTSERCKYLDISSKRFTDVNERNQGTWDNPYEQCDFASGKCTMLIAILIPRKA